MYDPFDLTDAVIRDFPHVKVTRQSPKDKRRCEYRKLFKSDGLADADYWIRREYDFLLYFAFKDMRHVVEHSELRQGGDGTQVRNVEAVATFDAGITISDWLKLRPRYPDGTVQTHPFVHAGLFLSLLRACMVALREIHQHGIVHLDIKADNICLPYQPYPYNKSGPVSIRFERIRLIDFAFSITPERPLTKPLPIASGADYHSPRMQQALHQDWGSGSGIHAQALDWRDDLYSLGVMAEKISNQANLLLPRGGSGLPAMTLAIQLVRWLKTCGTAELPGDGQLPHDRAIAEIDAKLKALEDLETHRSFEVLGNTISGRGTPTTITPEAMLSSIGHAKSRPNANNPLPSGKNSDKKPLPTQKGDTNSLSLWERIRVRVLIKTPSMAVFIWALVAIVMVSGGFWAYDAWHKSPHTQYLDCPAGLDEAAMASFSQTAQTLWPRVHKEADAAAVWNSTSDQLKSDLNRAQPSADGPQTKARALVCLAAMAEAGDPTAGQRRKAFEESYTRQKADFVDWLIDWKQGKRSSKPKGFELWRENGYALDGAGNGTAKSDMAALEQLGLGRSD